MKPHHAFVLIVVLLVLAACSDDTTPAPVMTVPATAAAVGIAKAAGTDAPTPVVTSAPSSTPTNTPAPTATHTPTSTPTPTATPVPPPQAVQLTSGGCCTQPFWSPDAQEIRFIDKSGADQAVGIWGVSIDTPLAAPQFATDRLAESTAGAKYLIDTDNGTTVIERRADGQRWTVPAGGRNVFISPDDTRIAWTVTNDDASPGQQVARLWLANLDGSDARQIATLPRGGLSGWVSPDTLLISSRENQQAREQVLSTLSLADGSRTELARAERLRGQILSPGGGWVVYYVTFDADPARNGLWVVSTDGEQKRQLSGDLFGSYQWRPCLGGCSPADDRLVIVPMQIDAPQHWLVELNPATGEVRHLTDPAMTPFKIANGDWRISPDGRHVAYVEASDRNVWVIELPAR